MKWKLVFCIVLIFTLVSNLLWIYKNDIDTKVSYDQGKTDGRGSGYNIWDPSFNEMKVFIDSDQTNQNKYSDTYTCLDFSADMKNNAFYEGLICGFVYVELPQNLSHALICFNTTDGGLVFVEPQNDKIVHLEVGHPYVHTFAANNTVTDFKIFW